MIEDLEPEFNQFGSTEALVRDIQERSDDITVVVIPKKKTGMTRDGVQIMDLTDVGMILRFSGGKARLIGFKDAEAVLNDGILNRMKIRIEIV